MANLGSIPREVLILIYAQCSDIKTALRLSLSCREHHEVWLKDCKHIVKRILEPEVAAFEDAFELALLECRFVDQVSVDETATASSVSNVGIDTEHGKEHVPVHLWLPRLRRNAEMATSVCSQMEIRQSELQPTDPRQNIQYTSWPKSYYFIRQFALSYHYPVLRPALLSALETCTLDTLQTHEKLCGFMVVDMSEEEQLRHGIPKPEEEMTLNDEINNNDSQPDWERALNIIWKMWLRRGCADALRQYVWGESMLTGPLEEGDDA